MYLGHGFDLSRSRDVIGHVTVGWTTQTWRTWLSRFWRQKRIHLFVEWRIWNNLGDFRRSGMRTKRYRNSIQQWWRVVIMSTTCSPPHQWRSLKAFEPIRPFVKSGIRPPLCLLNYRFQIWYIAPSHKTWYNIPESGRGVGHVTAVKCDIYLQSDFVVVKNWHILDYNYLLDQ